MNALFVTTADLSGGVGGDVATMEMATGIGQHPEFDLIVISPEPDGDLPDKLRAAVESFHFIPAQIETPGPKHILTQLHLIPAMLSELRSNKIEVVIARHSTALVVPTLISKLYGIDYVILARGLGNPELPFSSLLKAVFWLNVRTADLVYCAYEAVLNRAEAIRRPSQRPPRLFTNAVDPTVFKPVDQEFARSQLDIEFDESALVIGSVGSMKRYHMLRELLDSLPLLDSTIEVLLVGEGPEINELKRRTERLGLSDIVHFTGVVPHDVVNVYISSCDLMYSAGDPNSPGNSIKCYEYLACERPVIIDDRPDYSFIKEENLGYILNSITPRSIADAVSEFSKMSCDEKHRMGCRGREIIERDYNWGRLPAMILEDIESSPTNKSK